jgi:nicotinate-nucleotide adenylyltransferase
MCKFIALLRAGHNKVKLEEKVNLIKAEFGTAISIFETPVLEISSTEIRKRIREGLSVRYMIPEKVEKYIIENRLYKNV